MADGRLTLMLAVRLICKLIIMKDASKKNMMSISGMMTIRERRFGMGDGILIGRLQWLVAWPGDSGLCK